MRKYIDIVALNEGATFYPATYDPARKYFSIPAELCGTKDEECAVCDGAGHLGRYNGFTEADPCDECQATGKFEVDDWQMSLSTDYRKGRRLWEIMGIEPDGDSEHIAPEKLPELRAHLERYLSGDVGSKALPSSEEGGMSVDRSGNLPRLVRTATMHTGELPDALLQSFARRLIEIIDYAIAHKLWLVWA